MYCFFVYTREIDVDDKKGHFYLKRKIQDHHFKQRKHAALPPLIIGIFLGSVTNSGASHLFECPYNKVPLT